ncbi:MAG: molybdopterin-dependent oxidoreductase [Bacillota bacterium]
MRKILAPIVVLMLMIALLACAGESETPADAEPEEGNAQGITLVAPDGTEKEVSLGEIRELPATAEEISRETDEGREEFEVTGTTLENLSSFVDVDTEALESMVLVAGDGYSVEVPGDILENHDVIFAYELDGEPLAEGSAPLRAYLPGAESMYWVKNLVRIEFSASAEEIGGVGSIYFLETLFAELDGEDYEEDDRAVPTADILEYAGEGDSVFFLAADGFEKTEDREIFAEHHIVTTGETAPAFRGPELPRGMHVRDIVYFAVGKVAFYSVNRGPETFATEEIEDVPGVSLSQLAESVDLQTEGAFVLEATDGYEVEVEAEDLASGVVYLLESGEVAVAFRDLPKSANVKGLLCVRASE